MGWAETRGSKREFPGVSHGVIIAVKTGASEQTTLRLCEDLYHVYKNVKNNSQSALKLMIWPFYLLFS